VAVLMRPDAAGAAECNLVGMACILAGALSYGFAALWMRRLSGTPPIVSAAAQLVCSTMLLAPLAITIDGALELPLPDGRAMAAIGGLAMLSTALAYIVFFRISATAGPANVMLVTLLIPLTATALGVLVLGETLTAGHVAGALVIGAGLIVIDGRLLGRRAG
jgi:drug/metabolite transporter (DMT)-like permease